jgi:hypothetical protein
MSGSDTAGAMGGALVGRPRQVKILWIASGAGDPGVFVPAGFVQHRSDVYSGNGAGIRGSGLSISDRSPCTLNDTRHRHGIACGGIRVVVAFGTSELNRCVGWNGRWREETLCRNRGSGVTQQSLHGSRNGIESSILSFGSPDWKFVE